MTNFSLKYICLILTFVLSAIAATAQTAFWKSVRQGNHAFREGDFDKAEKIYHQSLTHDTLNPFLLYNLGNVNVSKNNTEEAKEYYQSADKHSKNNKLIKAYANHNMGVVSQMQAGKEKDKKQELLQQAIEHYKEALRNNPADEDTRYNLALCQYQLKKEQQKQQEQEQQDQQNNEDKKEQNQTGQDEKQKDKQQKHNNNNDNNPQKQPISPQTQQMMNLSRQEEQKTRNKLNNLPRGRTSLEKNW